MNPYDSEKSEPNFWLSCILVNEEAMCKQVRGEKDALYVPEHGKSCPTEILENLPNIMRRADQSGNQCICSRFIG